MNPQNAYPPRPDGQPAVPPAPQPPLGAGTPAVSGDIRPNTTPNPSVAPPAPAPVNYDPYGPPPAPPPKKRKIRESWRSVGGTVFLLILAPAIALSITAFAFQSYQVDGASMETTLSDKDRLIVNKLPRTISKLTDNPYIPGRGEIIIFSTSSSETLGGPPKQLIKRVIGLPGETVIVTDGTVLVTNAAQPEGFDPDEAGIYEIEAPVTPGEARFTLQEDELFVMGDNRTNSEDSRYFGPVKLDQVVGELSVRIMPLGEAQKF